MDESKNFIHAIIDEDLAPGGRCEGMTVRTRFPPEPNGFLQIGNAKAILINYTTAQKYGGTFNLRFDDTNPVKEDDEFVRAIIADLKWLGAHPDNIFYGSDYFPQCYEYAEKLIMDGKAFVCDLSQEETSATRGTLTEPGTNSPYRDRATEENLDLFRRMRAGEFPNGARTLRAKIDMSSPNMNMRDPVIYRIIHAEHHRQGNKWCIYPMYDYAHPIQDAIEGITHSLCSIEFENNRPLYDWVIDNIGFEKPPRQFEFSRLNMTHTILGKRYLRQIVESGCVDGWDDPRMPTLSGLRRRGYTPAPIRNFCERIGVAKTTSTVDHAFLEYCLREELNTTARRAMAVLRPVELIITNYPEGASESLEIENNPEDESAGTRKITFSRRLWIEADDFMAEPPKKYNRLYPGNEVRLKSAYIVKCTGYDTDEGGAVVRVYAEYDPATRGGMSPEGRKVRGTIHWVDAENCADAEVRLYGNLFLDAEPDTGESFTERLNPGSLEILTNCKCERMLGTAEPPQSFQFLRLGYFTADTKYSAPGRPVFNRAVALKDGFKPGGG